MMNKLQNTITYCERCSSTLYWDNKGIPHIAKLGNNNLTTCLDQGCTLLHVNVPEECFESGDMDLLRLALIQVGLSEEDAASAIGNLTFQFQKKVLAA